MSGRVWTAVRRWAETAPMPRVVLAGAAAWAVVATGIGGLVSLATG